MGGSQDSIELTTVEERRLSLEIGRVLEHRRLLDMRVQRQQLPRPCCWHRQGRAAGECDFPDVILSRYRHRLEDDMPVGEGSKLEISQSGDASARVLLPPLAKQSTP